ncbi:MAG: TusA-related sulfurtransferase [Psychromonas sp.]|jgi:TusA-related sulfurtransferase|uniref:sulfurtransferase TusA family protein n=1 Tax=Psychromonas sp. TaxID=1884585 RepID=UPI0039E37C6A
MEILDLQNMRCPMSLVKLKRYLLMHDSPSNKPQDRKLCLLFSHQQAMQDIILYLDKKRYDYSIVITDNQASLVMRIGTNTKRTKKVITLAGQNHP